MSRESRRGFLAASLICSVQPLRVCGREEFNHTVCLLHDTITVTVAKKANESLYLRTYAHTTLKIMPATTTLEDLPCCQTECSPFHCCCCWQDQWSQQEGGQEVCGCVLPVGYEGTCQVPLRLCWHTASSHNPRERERERERDVGA